MDGAAVVERDVLPVGRYRMPHPGRDGVLLRRGAVLERLAPRGRGAGGHARLAGRQPA